MEEEVSIDFKALRAKFQDEELLLKQPKIKPALPEKPKVVPPPQSPPHFLPAGARPSLLTSINQSLEKKTPIAPRVVFKDEKESKKPLIQINSKGKDKSEGKLKKSKDKTAKGSKEKLSEDSSDQKQKNGKDKRLSLLLPAKESTAELVPATPPPKATTTSKKGFLGFKKSKRNSAEVPADPILDTPSSDEPGQAPLIPVPSDAPPEPEIPTTRALLPNIPTLPESSSAVEITPPSTVSDSPDFIPAPAFLPDIPDPEVPTPEGETPLENETPALPISTPASQNEIIPNPPSSFPTPPPSRAVSDPPPDASSTPSPSPPEPEITDEVDAEAVSAAAMESPPPPLIDPPSIPPSPKAERPISALSALERAEDMGPGKRTPPCDQRIFNALEKARRKATRPQSYPSTSRSSSPPPEELSPPKSPTSSLPELPELPPIDYEDKAGNQKPAEVNGVDQTLEGITEEGSEPVPEMLVVPPPPPRKVLQDLESVVSAQEKPDRPLSVISLPPQEFNEIPAPPEFSVTDGTDLQEFDDVAADANSPELPVSEWENGEYAGPDVPVGQNPPEFYSNGRATPAADVAPTSGHQDAPQPESSLSVYQDSPPQSGLQAQGDDSINENVYEDVSLSATKKKGKTDGGKKRKGPPKNPYAETPQEPNEEKSKTSRFGKSDKKAAAEGPDEKELKKKEKQRLEKEKKELKEKQEREKKEQKEREKKENEMKKKFKITGQEDAMYQATVTVTTKGRKNDLPVKTGDIISIIRTTNCPKGKWLARDSSNNYGYVAVDHVELDIKEMLELGKRAAINRNSTGNLIEAEITSTGSRASNHYPLSTESFSDDSEEWTGDEEEPLSSPVTADPFAPMGHTRTLSMPDMGNKDLSINHQHSHSDISTEGSQIQAKHEALQKLATFFYSPKPVEPATSSTEPETGAVLAEEEAVQLPEVNSTEEMDLDQIDTLILPPPDLYADLSVE